jgi:xylose isomerase
MDTFARSLLIADKVLSGSNYLMFRKARYESFDKGAGKDFEDGKMSLESLRDIALAIGEPETRSGKQELMEQLINMFIV